MPTPIQQITSTLEDDGTITVALTESTLPDPQGTQVLVEVEAAPINPSDLYLMVGPSDLSNAVFSDGKISVPLPPVVAQAMATRQGKAMPVGNECSGTVIAAGDDAQHLVGKKVSCAPGGAFASHVLGDAQLLMVWPDDVDMHNASAAFVNPMTSLGFVETARAEGHNAILHSAAASNLGQMLHRICAADGIDLVNIVRKEEQAKLLRDMGAEYVINSSDGDYFDQLVAAIHKTRAMLGFDPIGGGTTANTMFQAMEAVAAEGMEYSRYGSDVEKKVYIYGSLDMSPRIMTLTYGFSWTLQGWLLITYMKNAAPEVLARMQGRILSEIDTTFASQFKASIPLADMLKEDIAMTYIAKRTGEKYVITPGK